MTVCWVLTPCTTAVHTQNFDGMRCLCSQGDRVCLGRYEEIFRKWVHYTDNQNHGKGEITDLAPSQWKLWMGNADYQIMNSPFQSQNIVYNHSTLLTLLAFNFTNAQFLWFRTNLSPPCSHASEFPHSLSTYSHIWYQTPTHLIV